MPRPAATIMRDITASVLPDLQNAGASFAYLPPSNSRHHFSHSLLDHFSGPLNCLRCRASSDASSVAAAYSSVRFDSVAVAGDGATQATKAVDVAPSTSKASRSSSVIFARR